MKIKLTDKQLYITTKIAEAIELSDSIYDVKQAITNWYQSQSLVRDLINDLDLSLLSEKQVYIIEKIKYYMFLNDSTTENDPDEMYI